MLISTSNKMSTTFCVSTFKNSIVRGCFRIFHSEAVEQKLMMAFDASYIVFDFGGCTISHADGSLVETPKYYIKPARSHFFYYNKPKDSNFIVVRLSPTGFNDLTRKHARAFMHSFYSLENIFDKQELAKLYAQLAEDTDIDRNAKAISNMLEKSFSDSISASPIQSILDEIIESNGILDLKQIESKFPYSKSTLNRYFKKYVGMPMALYSRLVKFSAIIRCLKTTDLLQEVIQKFKFYDQSHLHKDFKKFANISPQEYRGPNHKLLQVVLSEES